jgi:streptomycin 6-kinase
LIEVPERLGWWRDRTGGAAWLESLPQLAEECAERWSLRLGEPFGQGHVSLTAPATLSDGGQAVLKLNFPEEESAYEADALTHWRGEGAVRLLEVDRKRNALLIERAGLGTSLWEVEDDEEATLIASSALRRLWLRPPPDDHPFRLLTGEAERWTAQLRSDWEALGRRRDWSTKQPRLQGSNVLKAQREPWLAIDPKPIVAEPAFDVASLLRDRRWSIDRAIIQRRLDLLAAELDLDRDRMQGWGLVHALHWGVGPDKIEPDLVECARLLAA